MAVNSSTSTSTSTSGVSTTSIDVASIVSQLMTAENVPLDNLKSKISAQQVIISDLGTMKSKVSSLNDAIKAFEDPNSYNNMTTSSSDSSVVTATAANGAVAGNYAITVSQIATASNYALSGFASLTDPVSVDATNGFQITVGNTNYSTTGKVIVNGVVSTTQTVPALKANPTVSDLSAWINALGAKVSSNVVQTTGADQWALTISGTDTGVSNQVSYSGLNSGAVNTNATVLAQDAQFSINGINFTRSSNTVTTAVNNLTFNLQKPSAAGTSTTINVAGGADNSESLINRVVTAYNDLITQYTSLTANSANSSKPGTFGNSPTMLAFVQQIKSQMATGIAYGPVDPSTGKPKTMSLASLGMDLQLDGTIKYNSITHSQAASSGLQAILAQGVHIGYVDSTHNLSTFLTSEASGTGDINSEIQAQTQSVSDLQNKQAELQTRLNSIQNNYIAQYSNLNALLYQLSSTSNSLTSALTALTNMSAGK